MKQAKPVSNPADPAENSNDADPNASKSMLRQIGPGTVVNAYKPDGTHMLEVASGAVNWYTEDNTPRDDGKTRYMMKVAVNPADVEAAMETVFHLIKEKGASDGYVSFEMESAETTQRNRAQMAAARARAEQTRGSSAAEQQIGCGGNTGKTADEQTTGSNELAG